MDRLDVELYAERLARHAERAADDLADARLRQAWCDLERELREGLAAADVARLEGIGLLMPAASAAAVDRAVQERTRDLEAIHRLQAAVERSRQVVTGAIAIMRPPSSS
jgi:hypothetical protein